LWVPSQIERFPLCRKLVGSQVAVDDFGCLEGEPETEVERQVGVRLPGTKMRFQNSSSFVLTREVLLGHGDERAFLADPALEWAQFDAFERGSVCHPCPRMLHAHRVAQLLDMRLVHRSSLAPARRQSHRRPGDLLAHVRASFRTSTCCIYALSSAEATSEP
jgi:hypothetical protein